MHPKLLNRLFGDTPAMDRPGVCFNIRDEEDDDFDGAGGTGADDDLNPDEQENEEGDHGRKARFTSHDEAEKGYAALQSLRDRDVARMKRLEDQMAVLTAPKLTPAQHERDWIQESSQAMTNEILAELQGLDQNDPEYQKKFYGKLAGPFAKQSYEIARRVANESVQENSRAMSDREKAEAYALRCLEQEGLPESFLEDVRNEFHLTMQHDPDFINRVPRDEQIPQLVRQFKDKVTRIRTTELSAEEREQQQAERQEARTEQRRAGSGFIGKGAKVQKPKAEQKQESLSSTIDDMKRLRQQQRKLTGTKLGQVAGA